MTQKNRPYVFGSQNLELIADTGQCKSLVTNTKLYKATELATKLGTDERSLEHKVSIRIILRLISLEIL